MNKWLFEEENGIESINKYLKSIYEEIYPRKLKYYFFRVLNHLDWDAKGHLKRVPKDNFPFWRLCLSNNYKLDWKNNLKIIFIWEKWKKIERLSRF